MDSQIRGGANIKSGPISRISAFWVEESSGNEIVSPCAKPHATASICSPIQANGSSETYRSSLVIGSALARLIAIESRLRWESSASLDRKSTRLNSSHVAISYAVFCLKKKKKTKVIVKLIKIR